MKINMKLFRDIPQVIANRIMITILIGIGCAVFGTAYWLYTADKIMLALSWFVFSASIYRGVALYIAAKKKQYEKVEGTCVGVSSRFIGKFKKVKIMNDEGIETTVHIAKNCRLTIGEKYRLYFKKVQDGIGNITGSGYINTALVTDMFLGYERIASHSTNT